LALPSVILSSLYLVISLLLSTISTILSDKACCVRSQCYFNYCN